MSEEIKPVLLPKSDFKNHYSNPVESDTAIIESWDNECLVEKYKEGSLRKERFVLLSGPPYSNGNMHMGHALNLVIKDTVARGASVYNNKNSLFRPGFDNHGLPIEWKVEELYRSENIDVSTVSVMDFRKRCKEYALSWVGVQKDQMKKLGVFADWDNPYLTLSPEADSCTVSMVHKTLMDGYLYRAERPVLWSVAEQTALADAEVEYKDSRYQSLYVCFPLKECYSELFSDKNNVNLVVWTSTPWTLPGNRAVAMNADATYVVYVDLDNNKKYVMAMDCYNDFVEKTGLRLQYEFEFDGMDLADRASCYHPLSGFDNEVQVVSADFVKTNTGTGFVHIAPALGPDDFYLGKKLDLSLEPVLGPDGKYTSNVPVFAGQTVLTSDGKWGEAQGNVLNNLKENGNMVHLSNAKHSCAFSWRSKTPLVYRTTSQWFVKCDHLKEVALDEVDSIRMYPSESKNRLVSMLSGRPDWCISRQRKWGVPLGLFVNKQTNEVLKDEAVNSLVQNFFKEFGSDCWYTTDESYFLSGLGYNSQDYEKVMDVCDVWFESGAVWSWVNGNYRHSHVLIEGTDQHRGWFQSSLLEHAMFKDYGYLTKNIITHGFLLDSKNKKMSKSEGNVVDPLQVIEKYGADTLRHFVLSSDYFSDVKISDKILEASSKSMKKIRGTMSWLLGNSGFKGQSPLPNKDLRMVDKWIILKASELTNKVCKNVEVFNYHQVLVDLFDFCNNELSAVWFSSAKDSLYCDPVSSLSRRSIVTTVNLILKVMMNLFQPLFPIMVQQVMNHYHSPFTIGIEELGFFEEGLDMTILQKFEKVLELKGLAGLSMDKAQKDSGFKSTLEMKIVINTNFGWLTYVNFDDIIGVSKVVIGELETDEKESVAVYKADGHKCPRCWKYHDEDSDMCLRCEGV